MSLLGGLKFPEVLWRIVNDDQFMSIGWSEEGTSVVVREQDFIEEVLEAEDEKKVFQTNSFASFIRNLNFYGFACRRIATENETAIHSCFCPYFQRDRPELRSRVSRGPNSRRWMALFEADGKPKEGVKGLLEDLTNNGNKRRSLFTNVKRDEELAAKFVRIAPKPSASAALLLGEHNIGDTVLREPPIQPRRLSSLRPPSPSLKKLVHDALEIPTTPPMMAQPVVMMPQQQQQSSQPAQIVYMLPIVVPQSPVEMATTAVQTTATLSTAINYFNSNVFTQTTVPTQRDRPKSSTSKEDFPTTDRPTISEGQLAKTSTYDDVTLQMTCEDDTSTAAPDKLTARPGKVVRRATRNQARTARVVMQSIAEENGQEL
ncbi:uncharacterized protein LOC118418210 [Branchiostoma floridae]|uniref:Uncharacterized protein LOC118418210 n=1 Tax=Branchiostoma floridae TaxID=7739 RepID=A0A9J7LBS8_BRAFL|nr:uncharacterized protein LOC118418210 [Branchiostoma floridae]